MNGTGSQLSQKRDDCNPPLFVATRQRNVDMVEFLIKECHADPEECGTFEDPVFDGEESFTPLWCAAILEDFKMLNVLINLGADINAALNNGSTPVLTFCSINVGIVKFLVEHGADIKKPDNYGTTCLMHAVWSKEMCQILIDSGVEVNAQDSSGNTALRWAIKNPSGNHLDKEEIVQLLIDHGSNPNLKNEEGEDVFLLAVLKGEESILNKLLLKFELPVRRRIEFYELLGAVYVQDNQTVDIGKVMSSWKKAVDIRRMHSYFDVYASTPNPVYLFAREVNTMVELETLSRNHDLLRMHALMINEQTLGPDHRRVEAGLLVQAKLYNQDGEFRRCIDILRYAYQIRNTSVMQLNNPFYIPNSLYTLCLRFCEAHIRNYCRIKFEEVFQVLNMAMSTIDGATAIALSQKESNWILSTFMMMILQLLKLTTELVKNENQRLSIEKVVYRLVCKELKTRKGQTLLHLAVKPSTSEVGRRIITLCPNMSDVPWGFFSRFPSIVVVELLIECGAKVNAVDNENNTVLHLCSKDLRNLKMKEHHDVLKRIAVILLKNKAHVDMVNISGESAAKSLASSLIDINIQDYVSLKCLAACVVLDYNISYIGYIPASLESFVQMHAQPTANPICESPITLTDYLELCGSL